MATGSEQNPLVNLFDQQKLPFVLHGSADSLDRDIIYIVDGAIPGANACHHFCNKHTGAGSENRNVVSVHPGRHLVQDCYKGTPDAINNQILETFGNHKQLCFAEQCPIVRKVRRQVILKVVRSMRQILGFVGSVHHQKYHANVKRALKTRNFYNRLLCFATLDFVDIFLPASPNEQPNFNMDVLKSLAFQLVQTSGQFDYKELYSKKQIVQFDQRIRPLLYREKYWISELDKETGSYENAKQVFSVLNEYRDQIVQQLEHVTVVQQGDLNLFFLKEKPKLFNSFTIECNGTIVDMSKERCVFYPLNHMIPIPLLKHHTKSVTENIVAEIMEVKTILPSHSSRMISIFTHHHKIFFATECFLDSKPVTPEETEEAKWIAIAKGLFVKGLQELLQLETYHYLFALVQKHNSCNYELVLVGLRDRLTCELLPSKQRNEHIATLNSDIVTPLPSAEETTMLLPETLVDYHRKHLLYSNNNFLLAKDQQEPESQCWWYIG